MSLCEETCLRMVRYCQNCSGEDGDDGMSEDKTLKEIALALLEKYRTVAEALIYENSGRITEDLMEADCEYGWIRKQIENAAEPKWIPVSERLPKELKPVNITYINEDPAPYYEHIKGIPFTATAIYYMGGWYWWSCTCADVLAEYGHSYSDSMDEGIEVTAWMPLPESFKGGDA